MIIPVTSILVSSLPMVKSSFSWVGPARWNGLGSIFELYTKVAKEKKMTISEQESSQPYM